MLYPYNMASGSSKSLAKALNIKRIKKEGSNFKGGPGKTVINWGNSMTTPEIDKCIVLNPAIAVKNASNKLKFFEMCKGKVNIPDFTTNKDEAEEWNKEGKVCGRETLTGHSGQGLYVIEKGGFGNFNHGSFKVYCKYIPKKEEYRVHIVNGEIIDVRRKAIIKGKKPLSFEIRSHANGFIFQKNDFETPKKVLDESLKAMMVSGLDFGAVDVIWNVFRDEAYVLEINTAPGLEGSSVDNYAKAFEAILKDEQLVLKKRQEMLNLKAGLKVGKAKFNIMEWAVAQNEVDVMQPVDPFEEGF